MRFMPKLFMLILVFLTACGQAPTQNLPTIETSPTPLTAASPGATTVSSTEIAQMIDATVTPAPQPGTIRIVHAAPDTPSVNLITGIQAIATNLDYAQATEPIPVEAGEHLVSIVASGSRPNDPPLLESTFNVQGGKALIVVLAKEGGQLSLVTFPDSVEPLNPGESIITVMNAIPLSENVEILLGTNSLTSSIPFGETVITPVLPSGDTRLELQAGDVRQTYDTTLEEGRHYTLVLTGSPENISVASFSSAAPGRATVRAINASSAVSQVDFYLNDTLIAERAALGRPAPRQNFISGQYVLNIYEAGADPATAPTVVSQIVDLQPGENTSFVLLGSENNLTVVPYIENLSPTPPNSTRIAFLNTLDSVPTLHLETSGGPLSQIPDRGFGEPPIQALLGSGTHTFYLTRTGNPDENLTVETIQNVELEAGTSYLFLITGRDDNQPVILSEDVGVDETLSQDLSEQPLESAANAQAQIHFINAITNQIPLDFRLNDSIVANVTYGQGSEFVTAAAGAATITVTSEGSDIVLQVVDDTLESGEHYTVVAYGTDENDVRLMLISDAALIFDGRSPYLRLINVSLSNDVSIGLGFSTQDPTPQPGVTIEPNQDLRRSIPGGIQQLVENILGGTVSPVILMPTGIFDMEILDTATNQLATTVLNVNLEADRHYDIIAYEEQDTTRILAFVVQYPADSS
jgi:hypothetical protein